MVSSCCDRWGLTLVHSQSSVATVACNAASTGAWISIIAGMAFRGGGGKLGGVTTQHHNDVNVGKNSLEMSFIWLIKSGDYSMHITVHLLVSMISIN